MQQSADIYLLLNYFTCFGRPSRPSSGVHKTVAAASGTDHTIWEASFFKRDQIRTSPGIEQIPSELIRAGDRTVRYGISRLVYFILNKDGLPEEWKETIIVPYL